MCGIAGIINYKESEDKRELLKGMIGRMHHRGPDASGIYLNGPAGLAHTRLSIIDLSSGDQPIHNEDRSLWITFNGEIFNYRELRRDLEDQRHVFYTQSDTEVLLHLYEELGVAMLEKLNGQFAFAIWDQRSESLFLARDRVGIRPLFYHFQDRRFLFASEVKALFEDPSLSRSLDPVALSDIFTCWTPLGELTPFNEVLQLLPGHYARVTRQGFETKPYWRIRFQDQEFGEKSLADWTEELDHLLRDATRIRLRADVPVGAYLSGGIDSTFICSLVKTNFNDRPRTFSIGFTDDRFDESSFQLQAVSALGTEHQSIQCRERDIGEAFPEVIWHTETPIFRTAPAPLYMLSKLVRDNNFKVVLTGEGADEIFAGYNIFKEDKIRRFWARSPDSKLRPLLLGRLYPYVFSGGNGRSRAFLEAFFKKELNSTDSPAYSHLLRWQNTSRLQSFLSDQFRIESCSLNHFIDRFTAALPAEFMRWEPLSRAQYTEIVIFLSNYLLSSQGDRMAMAHSVEGRYPYLDHRVIEFACRVPTKFRMNGLEEKYILKKVARDLLPPELVDRPKQPYRAPIGRCFFGEPSPGYVEDLLSEKSIQETGYFDCARVQRLVSKCRRQDGQLQSERENMALVGILSTQLLDHLFIQDHPTYPVVKTKDLRVYTE